MNVLIKAFECQGFEAQLLTSQHIPTLQNLFDHCAEFFIENEGKQGTAQSAFSNLPQGKSMQDKVCFGFWEGKVMIAFLDLIVNLPTEGTVTIGYLLIHPEKRSLKRGYSIVKALEKGILGLNCREMRVVVQQQNARALQFWKKEGFAIKDKKVQNLSHQQNNVFICEKNLHKGAVANAKSAS